MALLNQFRQFAQSMTPQGAKAKVKELMQSGQMSQQQFDQLSQQAQQFMSMFRR